MTLLVQKFGGTSLATPERMKRVAARVARARERDDQVIVVASAMGSTTDELLTLAERVAPVARRRHPRELDMLLTAGERIAMALLAMAIREAGVDAISFTGSQAAIITDAAHGGARIEEVRAARVRDALDDGVVVIVAGFQGVSRTREVTTLGRGGSDTTAVALAAALEASACEIYTDVDGVYSADPRKVAAARRIERIGYDEMLELAQGGAGVLHPRAVELAARYRVALRVLSSFEDADEGGTRIIYKEPGMEELALTGLASDGGYARLVFHGLPGGLEPLAKLLSRLADAGVSVDMVAYAQRADGGRDVQISVRETDLDDARRVLDGLDPPVPAEHVDIRTDLVRLALVGSGMHGRPGVYATALDTLVAAGIDVHAISTSTISITLLIEAAQEARALTLLHEAFDLGSAAT